MTPWRSPPRRYAWIEFSGKHSSVLLRAEVEQLVNEDYSTFGLAVERIFAARGKMLVVMQNFYG